MRRSRVLTLTILLALCALMLNSGFPAGPALAQEGGPAAPADAASVPGSADAIQAALSSAITYQGSLKKSGQPVNATCSFQFDLWDAASGGAQTGNTQAVDNVPVQAGAFTVQLNFGNQFTGDARWIQTAVRCAGDGGFTALAPRQPLNAVPYAIGLRPGAVVRSARAGDIVYVEQNLANSNALHGKGTASGSIGVWGEGVNNTGVYGLSQGGVGVQGASTSWAGVWGQSTSASGVVGRSAGQFAGGVYGENTGAGYGVYGKAANNVAVFGESSTFDAVLGITTALNRVGVKGVANGLGAVGVWGESTLNTGVYGQAGTVGGAALWGNNTAGGVALRANGTAIQNVDKGGLVKALVHVQRSGVIDRCYNGVSGESANGCGFTVQHTVQGFYRIAFGFQVVDRFIQVTPEAGSTGDGSLVTMRAMTYPDAVNRVGVYSERLLDRSSADTGFWLTIH